MSSLSSDGKNYSGGSSSITTLVCKICDMTFLSHERAKAEAHIRTAHPESFQETISCRICGANFLKSEINEFIKHCRLNHPEELDKLQ